MKKRIFGTLLMGALVAFGGVFVSCTDYDDDIKSLQTQIDANKKLIDQINTLVTSGSVITNVQESGRDVIITVTSQNGTTSTYTVKGGQDGAAGAKGADGANGADGKSSVVTMGDNGNWFINGEDTGKPWKGEKGEKGDQGATGATGATGAAGAAGAAGSNGKDGVYYVPGTEGAEAGFWVKVDPNTNPATRTVTSDKWTSSDPNAVSAVYDTEAGTLTLTNVSGAADGTYVLSLNNHVRSLVFEADNQGRYYIDGVPGIRVGKFTYSPLTVTAKDAQGETWAVAAGTAAENINPDVFATYHVNPANAKESELQNLKYVIKKDAEYERTRATASADFAAEAEFVKFEKGVLTVKVKTKGVAATGDNISVIALQTTPDDGAAVTSDYTAVVNNDMDALRFFNKVEFDAAKAADATAACAFHYRRLAIDDNTNDDAETRANVAGKKAWTSVAKEATSTTGLVADWDIQLAYNDAEGVDLDDYIKVHNYDAATPACKETEANLEALGLTVKYEVVKNYKLGSTETDQADFITLNAETNVITARVFSTDGRAAIGRTPIIRASLMQGDKVVEVAYIKVSIVDEVFDPLPDAITLNVNDFDFTCDAAGKKVTTTVEQINVQLYNVLRTYGISRETFYTDYTVDATSLAHQWEATAYADGGKSVGTVVEKAATETTIETTHLYEWTLTSDQLWENKGKQVYHYIKYTNAAGGTLNVKLVANVAGVQTTYDIAEAKYISEYWNADKTIAKFNVNVPQSTTDADPTHCLFQNDLNSPFVTYPISTTHALDGILKVADAVTTVNYAFHDSNKGDKVYGGKTYTFDINAAGDLVVTKVDGTALGAPETIAKITNGIAWAEGQAGGRNKIELQKTSDIAKVLLNTNEFKVNIMAEGFICNDATKKVSITFKGQPYYVAQYVRPIYVTDNAAGNFIDGVDVGEPGYYINIKSLLSPYDWRDRAFGIKTTDKYYNYWAYYGPITVTFANTEETAQIKLNGEWQAIPATVVVKQEDGPFGTETAAEAAYGYVTYKNNSTLLTADTEMRVKVTVKYGWGEFLTDWITVPVKKTIIGGGE